MSDTVTKKELQTVLKEQTDEITGILHAFMQQVDGRFNTIESEITQLKESHNRLLNTIDGFVARIDKYGNRASSTR